MLDWKPNKDSHLYEFELELWSGKIWRRLGEELPTWAWEVKGPCTRPGVKTITEVELEQVADRVERELGEAIIACEAVLRVKNGLTQFFLASAGSDIFDKGKERER